MNIVTCNVVGYNTENETLGIDSPDLWILFSFRMDRLVYVRPNYTEKGQIDEETSIILLHGDHNEQVTDIHYHELIKAWTAYESRRNH